MLISVPAPKQQKKKLKKQKRPTHVVFIGRVSGQIPQ